MREFRVTASSLKDVIGTVVHAPYPKAAAIKVAATCGCRGVGKLTVHLSDSSSRSHEVAYKLAKVDSTGVERDQDRWKRTTRWNQRICEHGSHRKKREKLDTR